MSSPNSNTKSQTVGTALGQSQTLLTRRSTWASSKSLRLPQVSPPPTPCSPRSFTRRHRAGSRGRGQPFKRSKGRGHAAGWRRGAARCRGKMTFPGVRHLVDWSKHVGLPRAVGGANPGPGAAGIAPRWRPPLVCGCRLLRSCRALPGPGSGLRGPRAPNQRRRVRDGAGRRQGDWGSWRVLRRLWRRGTGKGGAGSEEEGRE